MRKKKCIGILSFLFMLLLIAGCGEQEEDAQITVDTEYAAVPYSLVSAEYGDVIKTLNLTTLSVQSQEQEVSFDTTGQYVNKVYVRRGDIVKKGDLLCSLSSSNLEQEIEDLSYSITRAEMQLAYYDEEERLAIQDVWLPYVESNKDSSDAKDAVKDIQENYARKRVLINDSLEFDREELAKKQEELRKSSVYATLDGTVYQIDHNLEGSTTKAGKVIMTVIDSSECFFKVEGIENKDLFSEGSLYDMKVGFGKGAGDYLVTPYEKDKWEEEMIFSVYTGPDEAEIEVGTYGTLSVVLDKRENVLTVPKSVVKSAGDSYYVYTLGEEDIREITYVTVGLIGDDSVEILSGISEGEKIVKK